MLASLVPSLAPIAARAQSGASAVVTIRDAETEAFLRGIAHPLFRAAGVDPALVRITLMQSRPINAFVTSGNRMFINTGLIQQAGASGELAGVLAHETGHIAGGHVARLPEEMRNAFIRSIAGLLLGGAAAMGGGRQRRGKAGAAMLLGGQTMAMGELYAFTRAQEQAADQAGDRPISTGSAGPPGAGDLLGRLREQEMLAVGRQDPYFRTHPLSRDRLEFVADHVARSRTGRGALPGRARGRLPAGARQAGRLHRAAEATCEALPRKRYRPPGPLCPGDRTISFRPGRCRARAAGAAGAGAAGQSLDAGTAGPDPFRGGPLRESVAPCREAARLAPGEALIRTALGRALMEAGEPAADPRRGWRSSRPACRPSATAASPGGSSASCRAGWGRCRRPTWRWRRRRCWTATTPVRLRARRAEEALPPGPLKLRAQDLREAARRDNLTREQREQDDAMRRRQPPVRAFPGLSDPGGRPRLRPAGLGAGLLAGAAAGDRRRPARRAEAGPDHPARRAGGAGSRPIPPPRPTPSGRRSRRRRRRCSATRTTR